MSEPKIYMPEMGRHNVDFEASVKRLNDAQTYKDLSTVIVCPTRGVIPARVVGTWFNLIKPMNQKVYGPIFMSGMEVGYAYDKIVADILSDPTLSKCKYLLTIEEDNMPPPDGLLKLYEAIEGAVDGIKYDVVGGLYWTKGETGQPMIYGDPLVMPINFVPQIPKPETVQRANGLGMGFNLFRLEMFKSVSKPWFKTEQSFTPGVGSRVYTQDLFFFEKAAKGGFMFACDTRVKVGHLDVETDIVW